MKNLEYLSGASTKPGLSVALTDVPLPSFLRDFIHEVLVIQKFSKTK